MRRALLLGLVAVLAALAAPAAFGSSYIVLYRAQAVPANAGSTIAKAGGSLVYSYPQIGVAIAKSDSAAFRTNLLADSRVQNAASTANFATQLSSGETSLAADSAPSGFPNPPATDSDNLSGLQWDMTQIHTPQAHAITGGSPSIVVGDIDTGLDYTHPDLAPNVDFANSVSCLGGVPNTSPSAWDDQNGHGTHTAGTIAAASNGIGIVGVAPNVRIAGIRAGNAAGYFFPEAVICSFVWAGSHGIDVTNNSYFADPWLFNCKNDPGQRAIWQAEQRAIEYAESRGTVVVSAEGNMSDDLAHPTHDVTSPDDSTPVSRDITNSCIVIPVEVPGVIGVTADGNKGFKSYYSSYGVGTVNVTAPGGDRRFQVTAAAVNGRVLSTYPAKFLNPANPLFVQDCSVNPCAVYAYLQGTSMASPHVAGVAALIKSWYGRIPPGQVTAIVDATADPVGCPDQAILDLFAPFPSVSNGAPQTCTGGTAYNSWYGHGQVNALAAISR